MEKKKPCLINFLLAIERELRRRRAEEAADGLSPSSNSSFGRNASSEQLEAHSPVCVAFTWREPFTFSLSFARSVARWLRRNATDVDELLNCARRIINEDNAR